MDKKIIYKDSGMVSAPASGTVTFFIRGKLGDRYEKNAAGAVSRMKLSIADSKNATFEYLEIEKIYTAIKKDGNEVIINLIYREATTEQKVRITKAIDKTLSFYLAVKSKNTDLAKMKLSELLANSDINQDDFNLASYYLELLENSY